VAAEAALPAAIRASTRVMSCEASVVVTGATSSDALARRGIARLHELEQRWSRFLPTSEISGLNHAEGAARIATPDTVRLVQALVQAWHLTAGAFDPTLLGTLVELGYASSRDDATTRTSLAAGVAPQGHPAGILVDAATGWIRLPRGTTLDPGGLGKGLAADIVVEQLIGDGATGALVEIGGDLRVAGTPPIGDAWTIAIAPAIDDRQPRIVQLSEGGVATSTSRLRTWTQQGEQRHHLIDSRTLRPADTGAVSCTVVAGSATWAEAFTKVAFAEHVDTALEQLESRGLAASITTGDDRQLDSRAWKEFCR
jgi:thiamine biosynthesis lipoprotein